MIQQGKVQVEQPPSYTDSLSLCTGSGGKGHCEAARG
jgi:hypothetical protein